MAFRNRLAQILAFDLREGLHHLPQRLHHPGAVLLDQPVGTFSQIGQQAFQGGCQALVLLPFGIDSPQLLLSLPVMPRTRISLRKQHGKLVMRRIAPHPAKLRERSRDLRQDAAGVTVERERHEDFGQRRQA